MTVEEAISVLERLAHTESKWPGTEDTLESLDMALSALRAHKEHGNNSPLTLDELREMAGEPYYHVGLQADSPDPHWVILDSFVARCPEDYGYGKTWLAYRHKPEDDATK